MNTLRYALKFFLCDTGDVVPIDLLTQFLSSLLSLFLLHVQIIAVRCYVNIVTQRVTQNKFVKGLFYIRDALSSNLNPETGCPT
jgi:hypothetical protein